MGGHHSQKKNTNKTKLNTKQGGLAPLNEEEPTPDQTLRQEYVSIQFNLFFRFLFFLFCFGTTFVYDQIFCFFRFFLPFSKT